MDWFQKSTQDAVKRREALAFLEWAERTHPAYLSNLKQGYKRYKEAKQ